VTAAEALDVAIEALTEYPIGDELPDEYANAATVVAALRDRLKEEEEFREAALLYCERAESFDHDAGLMEDMRAAYRRLVALRAVSKEPPR